MRSTRSTIVIASVAVSVTATPAVARAQDAGGPHNPSTELAVPWLLTPRGAELRLAGDAAQKSGLTLHLDHDFELFGLPLSTRMSASESGPHSTGDTMIVPMWHSELALRLPRGFFLGTAVESASAIPLTMSAVFGKTF
jgi:hypothetical protein